MNTTDDNIPIGIFDPYDLDENYWQWSNTKTDKRWEAAARQVQRGWLSKLKNLNDQQSVLWGVIDMGDDTFWVYRLFPAGRDQFGREGRFFFVLLELRSALPLASPLVAGIMRHFETERGLPLDVKPLDGHPHSTQPAAGQYELGALVGSRQRKGHWGMDGKGRVEVFTPPPPEPMPPPTPLQPVVKQPAVKPLASATASNHEATPRDEKPSVLPPAAEQPVVKPLASTTATNHEATHRDLWPSFLNRKGLAMVCASLLAIYLVHSHGYDYGYSDGYEEGRRIGSSEGRAEGEKEGLRKAQQEQDQRRNEFNRHGGVVTQNGTSNSTTGSQQKQSWIDWLWSKIRSWWPW